MIRILLSDDNAAFRQSSKEIGAALGFDINVFDDWENAQVELDSKFEQYHAVVIDGKGKLRDNTKAEDTKHLIEAVGWFREQRAKGRYLPVVVYTGFHPEIDEITNLSDQILRVFDKSKTRFEEVLHFLKERISILPDQKFKVAFPIVDEFAKRNFSEDNQKLLLEVFQLIDKKSDEFLWKKNVLDGLRRLNEALVDTIPMHYYSSPFELRDYIAKINRENPPKRKANMGNRTISIVDFFSVAYKGETQNEFPSPILSIIKNIYYTAASYASHTQEIQTEYFPSEEIIVGLVHCHFGCYHWFNSIIKN